MPVHSFSRQIIYTGKPEPPVQPTNLSAGDLNLRYASGELRSIYLGEFEILRSIYAAVRDRNWGTIEPNIFNEKIDTSQNHFKISFDCQYQQNDIDFIASFLIEGDEQNRLRFSMRGKAKTSFYKNRIGLCVLHPIATCAGKTCEIEHHDGSAEKLIFPEMISPHQPFFDIQSMKWLLADIGEAVLHFKGDIFETEDQRNWTDDSYKTYSTPLALTFPVLVNQGQSIEQIVELKVKSCKPLVAIKTDEPYELKFNPDKCLTSVLPDIGVSRSSEVHLLSEKEIHNLKVIHFDHYHVTCRLYQSSWDLELKAAVKESAELGWPLELALHFSENIENELNKFLDYCSSISPSVKRILLFDQSSHVTTGLIVQRAVIKLRNHFPDAEIGGGADANFAELNRNRSDVYDFDFVSYTICPQIHAFDDQTLIENLQGQVETVKSTKHIFGLPVSIGSITLKQPFNFVSTEPEQPVLPGELPSQVDVRQMSLFCADWTLSSIKRLAETDIRSLTYYETVGMRGLMQGDQSSLISEIFHSYPGMYFPVYSLFYEVLENSDKNIVSSKSSHLQVFDGLVISSDKYFKIILTNLSAKEITVKIPEAGKSIAMKYLDETNFYQASQSPHKIGYKLIEESVKEGFFSATLKPYAVHAYRFFKGSR